MVTPFQRLDAEPIARDLASYTLGFATLKDEF